MRKFLLSIFVITLVCFPTFIFSGCKKDPEFKDFVGTWTFDYGEIYLNDKLEKKFNIEGFVGGSDPYAISIYSNMYIDLKSDGSYTTNIFEPLISDPDPTAPPSAVDLEYHDFYWTVHKNKLILNGYVSWIDLLNTQQKQTSSVNMVLASLGSCSIVLRDNRLKFIISYEDFNQNLNQIEKVEYVIVTKKS